MPKAVDDYVGLLPGLVSEEVRTAEISKEDRLLHQYGYMDGKAFRNAGDKEKIEKRKVSG